MIPAFWLLLALAWGQEAPEEDPPDSRDPSGTYEITVYGEHAIRDARQAVISEMEGLGYRARTKGNGEIVFKPPKAWWGRAHLDREGLFWFGRPVVVLKTGGLQGADEAYDPYRELEGNTSTTAPGGSFSFYILPSKRKLAPVYQEVLEEVDDDLRGYRGTIQETAFQERLFELPGRLDALWETGEPLEGDEEIADRAARRAQVIDLWATRADTRHGDLVSETIETWLVEVVQASDDPCTEAEIAAGEARRVDGRRLPIAVTSPPGAPEPP